MIWTSQSPSTEPAWVTLSRLPAVIVAAIRKFCLSTASKSRFSVSIARPGTPMPPCTCASNALPVGMVTASPVPARRTCGGNPVYSGGVTQMSRLPAADSDPPGKAGVTARARRSRQSKPASMPPNSNNMARTARNPWRSLAANPAAGKPTRSERAASAMRRR